MTYLDRIQNCLAKMEIQDECEYFNKLPEHTEAVLSDLIKIKDQMKNTEMVTENLLKEKVELKHRVQKNYEDIERMKNEIQKVEEELSRKEEKIKVRKEDQTAKLQRLQQSASKVISLSKTVLEHLGVQTIVNRIDDENWEVKFVFAESKYVLVIYNANRSTFELRSIEPSHVRFDTIQQFLNDSQDMPGLLFALRKNHFFGIDDCDGQKEPDL